MRKLLLLIVPLFLYLALPAQSPIVFILDASGSMWGKLSGDIKMDIATEVLSNSVSELSDGQPVGLVAYGHRQKGDCQDVEFLVDMDNQDKGQVPQAMAGIKPLGKTPLAYSATLVIDQLRQSKTRATIILITDGIESCDGDLCKVVAQAKAEGVDFRLHIVGFGLKKGETEPLKCAAKAGEGQYYDAADAGGLTDVLREATTATVDEPLANFSVYAVKNGTPIDAYVKAIKVGETKGAGVARTYGDTAYFYLPPGDYDLKVQPLENSAVKALTVSGVKSTEGKIAHQTVSFDGGKINLITTNNEEGWDAVVKIYEKGSQSAVTGGRTYGRPKAFELNPGVYDLKLQALVVAGSGQTKRLENIVVRGNEVEEVEHNFQSGIAMIGANSPTGLVDAVVKIIDSGTQKNVAGGRTYTSASNNPRKFVLTPGKYEVTLNALGDHSGQKKTFELTVEAGGEVERMVQFE